LALFAIALAACAPSATPVSPTVPMQPTPIDYQRIGGFAGLNDHLTVDLDGHVRLTRRTGNFEFDLSRDELGAIQAALQTAGWSLLPENSMPLGVPADGFSYTITYQGHTVKTADTAIPKQLEPAITSLNRLIDSKGN
jgi:hypothetical protein